MSPSEINRAIADAIGEGDQYFIRKHGLFYRPGAAGYTHKSDEAWRLPLSKAKEFEYVGTGISDPITIHQCPPRNFCKSLDAMAVAEAWLVSNSDKAKADSLCFRYARALYGLVPKYDQPFMATAAQRAEAFLLAIRVDQGVAN